MRYCVYLLLVCISAACSVAKPELRVLDYKLIVQAEHSAQSERLSFFASVADKDGINDIAYMFIVHDETEQCWQLSKKNWTQKEDGETLWIGCNALAAGTASIPRGRYRLIVVDKAGERAERVFFLNTQDTAALAPPKLELNGTTLRLTSTYPSNLLLFFDAANNVTMTNDITNGSHSLDSLWAQGQWRSNADYAAVYSYDPKNNIGFFSWKIRLPD